jgi:pre-mRNA-splicing helicase BRR2
VTSGETVTVVVSLQREVDEDAEESSIGRVVCPRYPEEKTEGWWLVIGDTNSNSLLSIKRISLAAKSKVRADSLSYIIRDVYIIYKIFYLYIYNIQYIFF